MLRRPNHLMSHFTLYSVPLLTAFETGCAAYEAICTSSSRRRKRAHALESKHWQHNIHFSQLPDFIACSLSSVVGALTTRSCSIGEVIEPHPRRNCGTSMRATANLPQLLQLLHDAPS